MVEEFEGDLRTFRDMEQASLSAFAYYVAGACRVKTGRRIGEIVNMLNDVDELCALQMMSEGDRKTLYQCLYTGDFTLATPLLQPHLFSRDSFHQFVDWALLLPEPLPPQPQPLNCEICLMELDLEDAVPLEFCGHLFHNECISKHISVQIADGNLQPDCPTCRLPLTLEDVNMRSSDKDQSRYERLSLSQFLATHQDGYKHCMTPDCVYAFAYEGESDFQCPMCNKHYCLKCMTEFHPQFTCEEYRNAHNPAMVDDMFQRFVQGAHFKQCPNCKFFVEKSSGCNHMTCRCRYEFCYACGGQYGHCGH